MKFLGVVIGLSLASIVIWFKLFYRWHFALLSHLFGIGFFNKLLTSVFLLAESAAPAYLIFDKQFERLQRKLFRATMDMKGVSVTKAQGEDIQYVNAKLSKKQQQQKTADAKSSLQAKLLWKLAGFAVQLLVPADVKESKLMKFARTTVTLPLKVGVPFLLPLFAYFEGYSDSTQLLSQYWEQKGLETPEAQELVASAHSMDYRSFGAVASMLNYLPVLNWFLGLTNAVGAALWAAEIERKKRPLFQRRDL
jgi:GTP cyclohydrolase II